jgi:ABC-2 type transport system ATP-binding protein
MAISDSALATRAGNGQSSTQVNEVLRIEGLTKSFDGKTYAVDHVSFSVMQSEIFGFLGPNGAGKSTTINMLTTILRPTAGGATVCGHDLIREQMAVRRSIGVVPQDSTADEDLTGIENVLLCADFYGIPRAVSKPRAKELLELVELTKYEGKKVNTYSGGMKRRLELASGLINRPQLLFLDEPTLGLDPQTRNQLWTHVRHLTEKEGVTVFLTTHYMDEAERVAHRIAIIDHGRIVAQGSPGELKKQTSADSLEQAFLALTGSSIRDERANGADQMRQIAKMWRR